MDAATQRSGDQTLPNARLDELAARHIEASLGNSPTLATWMGVHSYDDRLDDVSAEAQSREIARLRLLSTRVAAISADDLDDTHKLDRRLLERDVRAGLWDLVDARTYEHNPLRYLALANAGIDTLLARDFAPLPDRLHALAGRLSRLRPLFDEARRQLRNPPEVHTRKAIELAQGTRSFLVETLPTAAAGVGDEKLAGEVRAASADAVRALDDFLGWMQRDLLPRAKGDPAIGKEKLADRLRIAEGIALPLDSLLPLAERELHAARQRYEEGLRTLGTGKSPEDDRPTDEQLLPTVSTDLDQLGSFLRERKLASVPDRRLLVADMPPFLWGMAFVSLPGPLEQRGQGPVFYVDPVDRSWNLKKREEHLRAMNRAQLALTAIHEGLPGHFLQSEAARRAPTAIERFSHDPVFTEGWAHYSEWMVLDEGFGAGDAKLRLLQLRSALVQSCRLVATLRFHAAGARIEELQKLFDDEAALDDYAGRREAERAVYDPMYAAAALGRLEILRLREDFHRARGDTARVGDFHDRLLEHGALPIDLLRRVLLPDGAGQLE